MVKNTGFIGVLNVFFSAWSLVNGCTRIGLKVLYYLLTRLADHCYSHSRQYTHILFRWSCLLFQLHSQRRMQLQLSTHCIFVYTARLELFSVFFFHICVLRCSQIIYGCSIYHRLMSIYIYRRCCSSSQISQMSLTWYPYCVVVEFKGHDWFRHFSQKSL